MPVDVEEREHPFGERGVISSLDEVAKRAVEGGKNAFVRQKTIQLLDAGRGRGRNVNTPRGRAEVLLEAGQEKLWVPDPVGTEFIQGAHLTLCADPEGPCFKGGDCDDLTVAVAASFLAAGLDTLIVGHAYDQSKQIAHVLAAVHLDNKWHYADPSPSAGRGQHFPLGKCAPFTRERLYSLPNMEAICDDVVCIGGMRTFNPDRFVERGAFIGVSGVPQELDYTPEFAERLQWIDSRIRWR